MGLVGAIKTVAGVAGDVLQKQGYGLASNEAVKQGLGKKLINRIKANTGDTVNSILSGPASKIKSTYGAISKQGQEEVINETLTHLDNLHKNFSGDDLNDHLTKLMNKGVDVTADQRLKDLGYGLDARKTLFSGGKVKEVKAGGVLGDTDVSLSDINNSLGSNDKIANLIKSDAAVEKSVNWGDMAESYFGDSEYGTNRLIAAGGALAVGAVGLRYATGGDLTHNGAGQNDIVGIPFI